MKFFGNLGSLITLTNLYWFWWSRKKKRFWWWQSN